MKCQLGLRTVTVLIGKNFEQKMQAYSLTF